MTAGQWIGSGPSANPLLQLPDRGPSPANMNANGGITLAVGNKVAPVAASTVDTTTLPSPDPLAAPNGQPAHAPGVEAAAGGQPAKVVVYVDFMCPFCADFHSSYGPSLDRLRNEGKITVEYRPVAYLDRQSTNRYSSRAAAAAAAGVDAAKCIDSGTFLAWARYSNRLAVDSGINGIPTAFVDGKQWGGGASSGLDFIQFLQANLNARAGVGS